MKVKLGLIVLFIFVMNVSFISAEIYRENGNIAYNFYLPEHPKIVRQEGIERDFTYQIAKVDKEIFDITSCLKLSSQLDTKTLAAVPVKEQTVDATSKVTTISEGTLDYDKNPCYKITVDFANTDKVLFGEHSTEIIIDEDNVTFSVTPETTNCETGICTSSIPITNHGSSAIVFDSSALQVELGADFSLSHDGQTENHQITIAPNETATFYLSGIFGAVGVYKYDVTFTYEGVDYLIDPFFNVTTSYPQTKFFYPANLSTYNGSDTVQFIGGAVASDAITSFKYEITSPTGSKTNYTVTIPNTTRYWSIYDDVSGSKGNTTTWNSIVGDTTTNLGRATEVILKDQNSAWIDAVNISIVSTSGSPATMSFIYNLSICTVSTPNFTSTPSHSDCNSSEILLSSNYNLSTAFGGAYGWKKLSFDFPFYMEYGKYYALMLSYVSGRDFDSGLDAFHTQADANTSMLRKQYKHTYHPVNGSPIIYLENVLMNYKLLQADTYIHNLSGFTENGTYTARIWATDSTGDTNFSGLLYFDVNYCAPSWSCIGYGVCNISDSQSCNSVNDTNTCNVSYTGNYSEFSAQSCNYCSEDLQITNLSVCVENGSQNFTWADDNYFGCCAVTGLLSDCSILYTPYNETGLQNCAYAINLTTDFEMQMDSLADFGFGVDKISGKIWLNDTNSTYTCLSYIKTLTGSVVQTNPSYSKRTDSTIAITQREIEDREFFITQNGIANVYWTNRNLVIDGRQYIFGVECSGNGQHLISEKLLTVGYKSVNEPITRWFWAKNNITGIIMVVIFGIIAVFIIAWIIYRVRRG